MRRVTIHRILARRLRAGLFVAFALLLAIPAGFAAPRAEGVEAPIPADARGGEEDPAPSESGKTEASEAALASPRRGDARAPRPDRHRVSTLDPHHSHARASQALASLAPSRRSEHDLRNGTGAPLLR
jgi:hypothetical protein